MWFISVENSGAGTVYKIKEQLTYTVTKTYKLGNLTIGAHSSPSLKEIEEGTIVKVCYNPQKPKKVYLPEN